MRTVRSRRSADKVMRTPISKQRNKHIQQVLVEAAKLAPRYSHELALIYEKEMQRGNRNRATLDVARMLVAWIVGVESRTNFFVPTEERGGTVAAKNLPMNEKHQDYSDAQTARPRKLATGRRSENSEAPVGLFRGWQRTQTQSSVRTLRSLRQQMDVWFCLMQESSAERALLRNGRS